MLRYGKYLSLRDETATTCCNFYIISALVITISLTRIYVHISKKFAFCFLIYKLFDVVETAAVTLIFRKVKLNM